MEPIEWIVGLMLFMGGYELGSKEEPKEPVMVAEVTQKQSVLSDVPIYERGRYYKTSEGYFISNLTPVPQKVGGCNPFGLTSDQTEPSNDDGQIQFTDIDLACEE